MEGNNLLFVTMNFPLSIAQVWEEKEKGQRQYHTF